MKYALNQAAILAVLASTVLALPLNINLGAYSPALVVGDGEISFSGGENGEGGARSAAELMETLATGAANSEAAAGANAAAPAPAGAAIVPAPAPPSEAAAPEAAPEGEAAPAEGEPAPAMIRKKVLTPLTEPFKRSEGESSPSAALDRRAVADDAASRPISSSQILGRSIEGFRTSLDYALKAYRITPQIDIATEAAGVGILVNPGVDIAKGSASDGTHKVKRTVPEGTGKAGITLLAIAEI